MLVLQIPLTSTSMNVQVTGGNATWRRVLHKYIASLYMLVRMVVCMQNPHVSHLCSAD